MYQKIQKVIKSDIKIINDVVDDMRSSIMLKLEEEELFSIKIVLSELIINSIKHGNNNDINKNIEIILVVDDAFIRISITDEGQGIRPKEYDYTLCSEDGRGLTLVKGFMDRFVIDGNNVLCVRYRR